MNPTQEYCEADTKKYYQVQEPRGNRVIRPALVYKFALLRRHNNTCDPVEFVSVPAWASCEGVARNPSVAFLPIYQPNGTCKCPPPNNPPNVTAMTTWDERKRECVACPLANPTDLETLIAQYDTTEEAKACTRRLEAGGNCDDLVKPALLTAKACLQAKMAEVGFIWDGSTTSLFRTRGYQAHFWDLFQKKWTKSGLAKLATDDPSAYKSCTPPPHGLHKNHGLAPKVANPDSVQPHHTTGSAFDISEGIVRRYEAALATWKRAHQKDANYKERTVTSEASVCGLRWGGNFDDYPHFDLGR